MDKLKSGNYRTTKGYISYPDLKTPVRYDGPDAKGDEAAYWRCVLVLPKEELAAVEAFCKTFAAESGIKNPSTPVRTQDDMTAKAWERHAETFGEETFSVTFKRRQFDEATLPPVLKDLSGNNITANDINPGDMVKIVFNPRAYSRGSNKGVSFDMLGVLRISSGISISTSSAAAESDFDDNDAMDSEVDF